MVNLDVMSTDDLVSFATDKSNDQRLRNYACHCIVATRLRLAGLISEALLREREAERIYDALPDALRWCIQEVTT